MGNFSFTKTEIEGVFIIDTKSFGDSRGYFIETYKESDFFDAGILSHFIQDNQSCSRKGVLRGLHFQKKYPQSKLVRVISGEVYDVAVDLRKCSPTYGKWVGVLLTEENKRQLFIPKGFAHGFVVLSDTAIFSYKCDEVYHPEDEGGIAWNDPTINVQWPEVDNLILSEKDRNNPFLSENGIVFDI